MHGYIHNTTYHLTATESSRSSLSVVIVLFFALTTLVSAQSYRCDWCVVGAGGWQAEGGCVSGGMGWS